MSGRISNVICFLVQFKPFVCCKSDLDLMKEMQIRDSLNAAQEPNASKSDNKTHLTGNDQLRPHAMSVGLLGIHRLIPQSSVLW